MATTKRIFLVDCPQGDPDLLTIKAHNIIRQADIVLYEAVARGIALTYDLPDRRPAGSALPPVLAGMIARLPECYRRIAWLGDLAPWLSDAGLEGLRRLRASGFCPDLVSGVSSFQAVTAKTGIPLTRRNSNESFWIPTGRIHLRDVMLAARTTATAVIPLPADRMKDVIWIFLAIRGDTEPVAMIDAHGRPAAYASLGTMDTLPDPSVPGILVIGRAVTDAMPDRRQKAMGCTLPEPIFCQPESLKT